MHPGTDIIRQLGYSLLAVLRDSVFLLSAYQLVMSLFGFWQRRKPPLKDPVTRFAVLVAAHNEAHVISDALDSLARQAYPRELFDVYVVADNCTDDTADVALLLEKVKPKYWWGVFMFAVYGLTWLPLDFIALFTRNDQTWFHTVHKQAAIPSK